jgi:AraC-like DNA-binding protein
LSDTLLSIVRHGESLQDVDLTELALNLLCNAVGISTADPKATSMDRIGVNVSNISDYIGTQLHRHDLTPKDIADHFNMSLRQLYRISCKAGCTPAGLMWRLRLERARSLLADRLHRTPITEIALSCGFKDVAHFSRSYRKSFDEAPRATRRNSVTASADAFLQYERKL